MYDAQIVRLTIEHDAGLNPILDQIAGVVRVDFWCFNFFDRAGYIGRNVHLVRSNRFVRLQLKAAQ